MAAACGLWDVGRMWFLFVLLKKNGFCAIEARILGQDRLTYCAAFSNLGVGVSITTGWGETEVFMEVSSRRLAIVQHRHPPARGLLSLISLLSAFLLTGIKRNQASHTPACGG